MSTLTPPLRTSPPPELSSTPGLVLLWGNSPNGWKCTIALEALKQSGSISNYVALPVNLSDGEQFQDWFKELNPNSKMPVLIDNRKDKPRISIFESGAILQYLARTYDKEHVYSFGEDDDDSFQEMINWIHLAQANLGPQQGQLNHFYRYSKVNCPYSIERFRTEVLRIYKVYEDHLSTGPRRYLVGSKPTFADFCTQPWLRCHFWAGIPLSELSSSFPHFERYIERIEGLEYVKDALLVPERDLVSRIREDPELEKRIMEGMQRKKEEQEKLKESKESKEE